MFETRQNSGASPMTHTDRLILRGLVPRTLHTGPAKSIDTRDCFETHQIEIAGKTRGSKDLSGRFNIKKQYRSHLAELPWNLILAAISIERTRTPSFTSKPLPILKASPLQIFTPAPAEPPAYASHRPALSRDLAQREVPNQDSTYSTQRSLALPMFSPTLSSRTH